MTWFIDFLKWIIELAVAGAVIFALVLIYFIYFRLRSLEGTCLEMNEKLDRLLVPPPRTKRPEEVPEAFRDRIRRILARYTDNDALYHITERLQVNDDLARDILEYIKAQPPTEEPPAPPLAGADAG